MIKNNFKYDELRNKKLFLLDMDGTIYLDNVLFEGCLDFLNKLKEIGGKYIFLTNNSSKSANDYILKLASLGIVVDSTNILTSSQATGLYLLNNYKNKKIYILGTKSLKRELLNKGLYITDQYEDDIDCLVIGFDTELTYSKLIDACKLLTKKVDFIATNPDLVCPTSFGFIPDCGSICNLLKTATGREPIYIGKPKSTMVELAIKNSGYSKEETIMIGDRLYTDIACGINSGITTALVLTGETKREDLENTVFEPDYVFENIKDIHDIYFTTK